MSGDGSAASDPETDDGSQSGSPETRDALPADAGDADAASSADPDGGIAAPSADARRVVATGTFDLLHPGHVDYLEQAAAMGEELHVVVARAESVTHKPAPVLPDEQRRAVVAALEVVDHARLGHPTDYSVPIVEIDPDVLVLGYDQHHDDREVGRMLAEWGVDCRVERAEPCPASGDELLSSSAIVDRVCERRDRSRGRRTPVEPTR